MVRGRTTIGARLLPWLCSRLVAAACLGACLGLTGCKQDALTRLVVRVGLEGRALAAAKVELSGELLPPAPAPASFTMVEHVVFGERGPVPRVVFRRQLGEGVAGRIRLTLRAQDSRGAPLPGVETVAEVDLLPGAERRLELTLGGARGDAGPGDGHRGDGTPGDGGHGDGGRVDGRSDGEACVPLSQACAQGASTCCQPQAKCKPSRGGAGAICCLPAGRSACAKPADCCQGDGQPAMTCSAKGAVCCPAAGSQCGDSSQCCPDSGCVGGVCCVPPGESCQPDQGPRCCRSLGCNSPPGKDEPRCCIALGEPCGASGSPALCCDPDAWRCEHRCCLPAAAQGCTRDEDCCVGGTPGVGCAWPPGPAAPAQGTCCVPEGRDCGEQGSPECCKWARCEKRQDGRWGCCLPAGSMCNGGGCCGQAKCQAPPNSASQVCCYPHGAGGCSAAPPDAPAQCCDPQDRCEQGRCCWPSGTACALGVDCCSGGCVTDSTGGGTCK